MEAKHLRLESTETIILGASRLNTTRKRAPRLIEVIYEFLAETKCPMWEAIIGWTSSKAEWCVLVRLIEPTNAPESWLADATERFADLVFDADSEGSYIVKKKGDPFDASMFTHPKMKFATNLAVYQGSPFLLYQDSKRQIDDELAWLSLLSWMANGCQNIKQKQEEVREYQRRSEVLPRLNPSGNKEPSMPTIKAEDKVTVAGIIEKPFLSFEAAKKQGFDLGDFLAKAMGCENFDVRLDYSASNYWRVTVDFFQSESRWDQWVSDIRAKFFSHFNENVVGVLRRNGLPDDAFYASNIRQSIRIKGYRGVVELDPQ
ncbi:hypothetical protein BDV18DRAFT_162908 [Aspergillus unguis]